jgi:hypothetical protein
LVTERTLISSVDQPVKTLVSGLDWFVAHGCAQSFFDLGDRFGITEVDVETDRELGFTFQGKSPFHDHVRGCTWEMLSAALREYSERQARAPSCNCTIGASASLKT